MQQVARYDIERLDEESINRILAPFKGRHVEVVVKEVKKEQSISQREMFKRSEEVRLRLRKIKVDPNLNLSDLANEVNL